MWQISQLAIELLHFQKTLCSTELIIVIVMMMMMIIIIIIQCS
jgi:hypothetical protein